MPKNCSWLARFLVDGLNALPWLCLAVALATSLLTCVGGALTPAAAQAAQPELTQAQRDELRDERNRLWDQVKELESKSQLKDAIAVAQQMLAIERRLFGDVHKEVAFSLEWIAEHQETLEDFPAAIAARTEALAIRRQLHGNGHWRVTDARLALDYAQFLSDLSADDRAELRRAAELNDQALDLESRAEYQQAIEAGRQALAIRQKLLGEQHRDYAESLNNLGFIYSSLGDYATAEPLYRQALEVRKQVLGEGHPKYAITLGNLGYIHSSQGHYAEAVPFYRQSLEINRQAYGEEHSNFALSLNNLAYAYMALGEYAQAEPLWLQALEINKQAFGEDSPDYALGLNNLAFLYKTKGDYAQAERMTRQALEIRKQALGEQHPLYAVSLNNLAELYRTVGDFARAEPHYREALEIRRQVFGEQHPDYAQSLNNLGLLYSAQGDSARAIPLFQQALAIARAALGEQHPDCATYLSNLGKEYDGMGNALEAEPLLQQALQIREQALGKEHPSYSTALNNLAELYRSQRDFVRAELLYQQALEIDEKKLGNQHPEFAIGLHNLAAMYADMGNYAQSALMYRRSADLMLRSLGGQHPNYARGLTNLGAVYSALGDFARAESVCQDSLRIQRAVLGPDHPDCADSLYNLATIYQATNRPGEALGSMQEGLLINQRNVERVLAATAESAMDAYLQTGTAWLPTLVSMAAQPEPVAGAGDAACLWTLRRKAILLDTLCRFREVQRLMEQDPQVRDQVIDVRGLRQQLSNLALNPPGGIDAAQLQQQLAKLRAEADRIETELHRTLSATRSEQAVAEITVEDVRRHLPQNAVLFEFLRESIRDFQAIGSEGEWQPDHYFVFVLTPDSEQPPRMLDLGEADAIEPAIDDWRQAITTNSDLIDNSTLRELLWQPLAQYAVDAQTILISPDGELNRFPFEALTNDDDEYLIEHHQFAYLSSGRDLLRTHGELGQGAVVLADPDYSLGAKERHDLAESLLASIDTTDSLRGALSDEVRGLSWKRLPGFASEAQAVGLTLQGTRFAPVQQYLGADALEEVLKSLHGPRLLHVITHGFFVTDRSTSLEGQPNLPLRSADLGAAQGLARLRDIDNPLLRSGIVLAGANALGDAGTAELQGDDGWVTAEEISQMDLRSTELVVLSACETGLGDVRTGEGVYGLRRAFLYAGAHTLITSLFKVPDQATSLLMRRFYRNLCTKNMTPLESLREAQLFSLRGGEDPNVDEISEDAEQRPPRDWAAFTLSGDWR